MRAQETAWHHVFQRILAPNTPLVVAPRRRQVPHPAVKWNRFQPVRSTTAAGVLAAVRPAITATRFASAMVPKATSTTDGGTVGLGTASIWWANRIHSHRPVV